MNIALTHIHAAASARSGGRNAFARAVVLGCAMACASVPGLAAADRGQDGQRNEPPRTERTVPAQPPQAQRQDHARQEQRQFDSRAYEARAEENRRQAQQQQQQQQDQGAGRRGGRLTPDERRELRRQINEAGIDLYPNAPRR